MKMLLKTSNFSVFAFLFLPFDEFADVPFFIEVFEEKRGKVDAKKEKKNVFFDFLFCQIYFWNLSIINCFI